MSKKELKQEKQTINWKAIWSYLALVIMAGLSYQGVKELIDGSQYIKTAFAILVVVLLVKTTLRK